MKHATRPSRVLSLLTALALLAPPPALAAPAQDAKALAAFEAGFTEGQAKFDRGEHLEAARTWIEAAANLKETTANRDNRAAVYEYVVDAFTRGLQGEKRPEALREAAQALDAYCEGFTRAYGTETPLSPKIVAARDEFKQRLAEAEAATAAEKPPVEDKVEGPEELPPPPSDDLPEPKPWKGLAIGGGVMLGLGVGAAVVAGVGAARVSSLEKQVDDPANMCVLAMPSPSCQDLLDRGKSAQSMAIAGAVLAPLLVGAGVGLLVVGLKRRSSPKTAFAPALGPGFAGLSLRGSF
ncbi:hypothetical protein SAMN02745121_06973 [Nannocystis exedens]|uniref:Uncharacterized protein n=1 Tax=Nannocystis exedens TaxID=54 RepID=A0A1I2G248_9BACT|nr:hypothetical protein [Nannocystis exedens]PCC74607.1 hypothetical protein NAEX_07704 [Nannocystis exedens]SFF10846.1 hypothetical protein SAMN02745121_06973 [Nannocystis exedens]